MSRVTKCYCDRCGRDVETIPDGVYQNDGTSRLHRIALDYYTGPCSSKVTELCDQCYTELLYWMKNGKKVD